MPKSNRPNIPPAYQLSYVPIGSTAFAAALQQVQGDGEPGRFLLAAREDQADCAVTLAPEGVYRDAYHIAYLAQVAIGDALGAIVPPAVEVQFGWPDRILINGATAGGIQLALAPPTDAGSAADWAALGLTLQVCMDPNDPAPGRDRARTSLHDEGCGDLTSLDILESYSRHLLYWINKYQDEGFAAVRKHYLSRTLGQDQSATVTFNGKNYQTTRLDIDDGGSVLLQHQGHALGFTLADALTEPTWTLKGSG